MGIDTGERLGVGFGPESDADIDLVDFFHGEGRDEFELFIGGVFVEEFLKAVGGGFEVDVGAGLDAFFIDGFEERHGDGVAGESDEVALFDTCGIIDDDIC